MEAILQVLYSWGYGSSKALMNCWGWEYPQTGKCTWPEEEEDYLFYYVIEI